MTLSPTSKKVLHSAAVAALSGGLAYLSGALAGGSIPKWQSLAVGVLAAAGSRLAGWALAKVETAP